ncbi:MAG: 4-(cytidine 5'-diphospho)-2-C-methyl-D-erythritol kinase [Lachnospiraceae bacterium]
MDELKLKALAKINVGLDVVRKREDGYHEVRMIMQTVNIYDKIKMSLRKDGKITVQTNLYYLPSNENNLVYKAAKLLKDEFQIPEGVHIELEKHIPVAAGMAGGSSDAAAVLFGMNKLFGLDLSKRQLMQRGVKIGADVPYCLMRGTALSEGIGEILTPLSPMPKCAVLVAKPGISVSTKFVYENLKLTDQTIHPDIDALVQDMKDRDLHALASHMGNVLETVTIPEFPVIAQLKEEMKRQGALQAMMSGSGPTVFGFFEDRSQAQKVCEDLQKKRLAKQLFVTSIYNNRK